MPPSQSVGRRDVVKHVVEASLIVVVDVFHNVLPSAPTFFQRMLADFGRLSNSV